MTDIFDNRNKAFMKLPCEQIYLERQQFLIDLRKYKRLESITKKRKIHGGNTKLTESQTTSLINKAIAFLTTDKNLSEDFDSWQGIHKLSLPDTISHILTAISKTVKNKEICFEPPILELFAFLCSKKNWCEVMVQLNILELLFDRIGFSSNDDLLLLIVLDICESCPEEAKQLIEFGIFEQIELVLMNQKHFAELCAYALYRMVFFSIQTLSEVSLKTAASLCQKLFSLQETRVWVYHCMYFVTQINGFEEHSNFLCEELFADLKNKQNSDLLLKILINLSAGPTSLLTALVNFGLFDVLHRYLVEGNTSTKRTVLKVLGNVAGGDNLIIAKFVCHQVFNKFIEFIDEYRYELRFEASFVLKNLGIQAQPLIFAQIAKHETFLAVSRALSSCAEVDKNLLCFLEHMFLCENFIPGVKELFRESGCKDKVEQMNFRVTPVGLRAYSVLRSFEEYENLEFQFN